VPDINESETQEKELQELASRDPFVHEVLLELARILASRTFERVQQHARDFLLFVVRNKLLGRSDQIKEIIIGVVVYREPDFNPLVSPKVRVGARALRKRLARYYATEGQNDPIVITIPKGTYVPDLHDRRMSIEVTDFQNLNLQGGEDWLCQAVSAEVVQSLNQTPWVRAISIQGPTVGTARLSYCLKGSLESSDGFVRLHISLASLQSAKMICWRCFKARRYDAIKLADEVADVIIRALRLLDRPSILAPRVPNLTEPVLPPNISPPFSNVT
jgi:TolB-like protein